MLGACPSVIVSVCIQYCMGLWVCDVDYVCMGVHWYLWVCVWVYMVCMGVCNCVCMGVCVYVLCVHGRMGVWVGCCCWGVGVPPIIKGPIIKG